MGGRGEGGGWGEGRVGDKPSRDTSGLVVGCRRANISSKAHVKVKVAPALSSTPISPY